MVRRTEKRLWMTLLSSGLGVALFTFTAEKTWEIYRHHDAGPRYVALSMRLEANQLLFFVRNNSDEPLDLTQATIDVDQSGVTRDFFMNVYPDISKIYHVTTTTGSASLRRIGDMLVVTLQITQAIAPKAADQFGVSIAGPVGPIDLSRARIRAELRDIKGQLYSISP
jgi:hypothetical protein